VILFQGNFEEADGIGDGAALIDRYGSLHRAIMYLAVVGESAGVFERVLESVAWVKYRRSDCFGRIRCAVLSWIAGNGMVEGAHVSPDYCLTRINH